jgi:hypothetical protein
MAAKPKLTPEQWLQVRKTWEADPRPTLPWLIVEMKLPVSAEGLRLRAKAECWSKLGESNAMLETSAPPSMHPQPREKALIGAVIAPASPTPNLDALALREQMFVREYSVSRNGSQAVIAAGYAKSGARTQACRLLARDNIQASLQELMAARCTELELDGKQILKAWHDVAFLDANELSQHRHRACRHCWGTDHAYQCTPAEYQGKRIAHIERQKNLMERTGEDIGGFPSIEGDWYDGKRDPNSDCPECHGLGIADVVLMDSRKLAGAARLAYCGTRKTKEGVEIVSLSREKAFENLARAMGLFHEESGDVKVGVIDAQALGILFADTMEKARAMQRAVLQERGLLEGGE